MGLVGIAGQWSGDLAHLCKVQYTVAECGGGGLFGGGRSHVGGWTPGPVAQMSFTGWVRVGHWIDPRRHGVPEFANPVE
jgi:hypothetical protein